MVDISLNPQVVIRSGRDASSSEIGVGEGTARHIVSCGDPRLVAWLLTLNTPRSESAVCESAAEAFSLDPAQAKGLLEYLRQQQVLLPRVSTAKSTETERLRERWKRWGWQDALDFHLAIRNCSFSEGDSQGWEEQDARMATYLRQVEEGLDEPSPGPYKSYPDCTPIRLDRSDELLGKAGFRDALYGRRTYRNFADTPLPWRTLSEVLEHSFAATHETSHPLLGTQILRTSPSGGARHPVEAYVVVLNVEGVNPGVYHYNTCDHSLEPIRLGSFGQEVRELAHRQAELDRAGAVVFFTVRWARHQWKYRYARSYRMVLFDVAHLVQTHLLVASALNLRAFLTPALRDSAVTDFLALPDDLEESPLYLTAIGARP